MNRILMYLILASLTFSCREEFTEEDALLAQQQVDLAIYAVDLGDQSNPPIPNATITVNQGDQTRTGTTDENGVVQFEDLKVGDIVYSISATDYVSISGTAEIDPVSFRVSQKVLEIGTYSLTNAANLATVKGRITVETDVTNTTRENAVDVPISISTTVAGQTYTFTGVSDVQGLYAIQVPVIEGSSQYQLTVPDLELDQTIALNKYADEAGTFFSSTQVLPRVEQLPTVFSIFRAGIDPAKKTIPANVRSIYARADDAPTGGSNAIISSVSTNALGEVTGLFFFNGGDYTGDSDDVVRIEVIGLGGGSGAVFDVPLSGATNLQIAFQNAVTAGTIMLPTGSGYFPNSGGGNTHLNSISLRAGGVDGFFGFAGFVPLVLQKGSIVYLQIDYGTGIAREREIL